MSPFEVVGARSLLSTLPTTKSGAEWVTRWARLGVATACAAGAAWVWHGASRSPALWIPTGLLVLSALLLHHGHVGSQLIARSVWWSNLVLGTLIALLADGSSDRNAGVELATTMGTALLAMGQLGLDEREGSAFRPVAFRTTLTLGMIMAVADAQALALFGVIKVADGWNRPDHQGRQGLMLLASATLLVVAIAGLYRLRVWGLFLATFCAAGVFAMSLADAYGLDELRIPLALTSTVQVLLPGPVFVAILGGRPGAATSWHPRLARLLPSALVVLMMTASVGRLVLHRW
jgi:hypothetical protein